MSTKRVYTDSGVWNQDALDAMYIIKTDMDAIYTKLEKAGYNHREAHVLVAEMNTESMLFKALDLK